MSENRYTACYARLGTSSCKKCKQKIEKGSLRIGKVVTNPFTEEGGDMKQWFHAPCIFETFVRARATTKIIEDADDVEDFADLKQEDKEYINGLIKDFLAKKGKSPKKKATVQTKLQASPSHKVQLTTKSDDTDRPSTSGAKSSDENVGSAQTDANEKDNAFREFRRLCAEIAEESSYLGKTKIVNTFLKKGSNGDKFTGDTYLWVKLLLPGVVKTVYNLNNKQLVKLFSQIFGTSLTQMVEDLEQGDVAETVKIFYDKSKLLPPVKKSVLSLHQVDALLNELSKVTKEDDQQKVLMKIAKKCTANDLKMVIRLIKHDLRINAGAKHILEGLDPNAYAAFQASRNLEDVVKRILENEQNGKPGMKKELTIKATLMTPVLPMLAEACRSVEFAMGKCPKGFYAEIKYDGERVQLHKKGSQFQYFSRSLKPVLPHKVNHFKDYIPKAFPTGGDLILDAEVLLIDNKTGVPLPFGSLGIHKRSKFEDANVCLFIFDCLHLNGENLMNKPVRQRRKILHENMTEIPNRIMFSEMKEIHDAEDLQDLMNKVFREGLEGLVIKDLNGIYEPGKRHWLKVKKDYLHAGSMADSADLVVLGAYYGSGSKGGIMSVFLMGVYDPDSKLWRTVTKVSSGYDDKTLDQLQKSLKVKKISKDFNKVPVWLDVKKQIVPDFVVEDPKEAPIWEISGAEFSKAEIHTAAGISIRFPRVTKMRPDKDWTNATNLKRLKELVEKSKDTSDFDVTGGKKRKMSAATSVSSPKKSKSHVDDSNNNAEMDEKTPSPQPVSSDDNGTETPNAIQKNGLSPDSGKSPQKSKTMCKYGAKCYQTNPAHLETFDHPSHPPAPGKDLPDIFRGIKIYLPKNTAKFKELKRYIVAFDGDVVNDYEKASATVIIVDIDEKHENDGSKAECVTVDWLWKCVKTQTLLPVAAYKA